MSDEPSFMDRMKDAAYRRECDRYNEIHRVSDIILSKTKFGSQRVGEIVKLVDDYVVEVLNRKNGEDSITWTFVVANKRGNWHYKTQDEAILHLIAYRRREHHSRDGVDAAFYAGRILGIH